MQMGVDKALMLTFRKGNRGVGNNRSLLNPGQCSWKDRGIGPSEPNRLCYKLGNHRFNASWSLPGKQPNFRADNLPRALKDLTDKDKYTEFQVYNNKKGCLVYTHTNLFLIAPRAIPLMQVQ